MSVLLTKDRKWWDHCRLIRQKYYSQHADLSEWVKVHLMIYILQNESVYNGTLFSILQPISDVFF